MDGAILSFCRGEFGDDGWGDFFSPFCTNGVGVPGSRRLLLGDGEIVSNIALKIECNQQKISFLNIVCCLHLEF